MKYKLIHNLVYLCFDNYLFFLDTAGPTNNILLDKKFKDKIDMPFIIIDDVKMKELEGHFPKKVILFVGNSFWKKNIFQFDYHNQKFGLISKIPKQIQKNNFPIYRGYANYGCIDCIFEGREERFVLDTGASRKGKNKNLYATSFLDGTIFDKLKYEKINNYDEDEPCIIIPEIIIFNKTIKNVKFVRRPQNRFKNYMSKAIGTKCVGAIGGNILKNFNFIYNMKNNKIHIL